MGSRRSLHGGADRNYITCEEGRHYLVAPFTGARIETPSCGLYPSTIIGSLPSRGRGSIPGRVDRLRSLGKSLPSRGRGSKQDHNAFAPRPDLSLPSRGRGSKHPDSELTCETWESRSLHGGADRNNPSELLVILALTSLPSRGRGSKPLKEAAKRFGFTVAPFTGARIERCSGCRVERDGMSLPSRGRGSKPRDGG